jgi:hypothetical protein
MILSTLSDVSPGGGTDDGGSIALQERLDRSDHHHHAAPLTRPPRSSRDLQWSATIVRAAVLLRRRASRSPCPLTAAVPPVSAFTLHGPHARLTAHSAAAT